LPFSDHNSPAPNPKLQFSFITTTAIQNHENDAKRLGKMLNYPPSSRCRAQIHTKAESAKNTWAFIATSEAFGSSFHGVLVNTGYIFPSFALKVAVAPKY
jgi:hypothetical protein